MLYKLPSTLESLPVEWESTFNFGLLADKLVQTL